MKVYDITPCPAPRQTKSDTWKPRPCVQRYRAFRDEVRLKSVAVPEAGAHVIFGMPMPKSWSKKKRAQMELQPHQQKPDVDNLLKALLDAIYDDDSHVHDIWVSKIWVRKPTILVMDQGLTPMEWISKETQKEAA